MFEEEILLGHTERSIALETRRNRRIANMMELDPTEQALTTYSLIRKKYGLSWRHRKDACGVYNCYGMVFAARRTSIFEDDQIPHILNDDGYRQVNEPEVRAGDIVFYRDAKTGTLFHVALILGRLESAGLSVLWALSKWNSTSGEDEHNVMHHCFGDGASLQYWTDR